MIDLHCHILAGIDDGARDTDDSLAMARQAATDGIEVVCATPHIRSDHDVRIAELTERVDALQAAVDAAGIPVRIVRGGEVAVPIVESLTDDELAVVAIGRWVLLEPAAGPLDESLIDTIAALRSRGYGSIVAHPERHPSAALEELLGQGVADGALVQATAAALADGGGAAAWLARLARDGLIHVLGSDAHSSRIGRPVELSRAYAQLDSLGVDVAAMRARAKSIVESDESGAGARFRHSR